MRANTNDAEGMMWICVACRCMLGRSFSLRIGRLAWLLREAARTEGVIAMRNNAWMAVCGMLLAGGMAMAQQPMPYGNPGGYGYPGYGLPPQMPYGPMPYGPMPPPYGQPMPNAPY